jgi:hypothetical protein
MGLSPTTLTRWKKDPSFIAAWEKKHKKITGGIETYSKALHQLWRIAMGEVPGTRPADQRSALMNYFELTDRYQPKKTIEIKDPSLLERSDEELMAEMKKKAKVIEIGMAKSAKRRRAS